jgi:hemolysin activation/secretion protein
MFLSRHQHAPAVLSLKTPDSWKVRETKFPLTPTLSPGEREHRQPSWARSWSQPNSTAGFIYALGSECLSLRACLKNAEDLSPRARPAAFLSSPALLLVLFLGFLGLGAAPKLMAGEPRAAQIAPPTSAAVEVPTGPERKATRHYDVRTYTIEGKPSLPADRLTPIFSRHTGTNVDLEEIVQAAADLQSEYRNHGWPVVSVAIAEHKITNGLVTFNVYQSAFSQVLVNGKPCLKADALASSLAAASTTKANAGVKTNEPPHFALRAYEVTGNTLLPERRVQTIMSKFTGTNVTFAEVASAQKELQMEYHTWGYDTVSVSVPQQRLTNATIKVQVVEGRLADIRLSGNRYFSSNNIMRSLPGLSTNRILDSHIFQAELDRANANQDRQIYPRVGPGPEPGTSSLVLAVKDRLPLHAKLELNNQGSPGTPELRLNSSAAYNNLWQLDHSVGVQYSFSPEAFKAGEQWQFFDQPLVANYSAFYRLPLAVPEAMDNALARGAANFGYNESTRKFELPPALGVPELNVYGSRATVDTAVQKGSPSRLFTSSVRTIDQATDHEDLTVNEDLGLRFSEPIREFAGFRSSLSAGLDFKTYRVSSFSTNYFIFTEHLQDSSGNPFTRNFVTPSPVPSNSRSLNYLPLSFRWDASRPDKRGRTDIGLNYSPNFWFSGSEQDFQAIAGSPHASGHWHIVSASLAREQNFNGEWILNLRADGQWASEPLISNEQFGVGGIAGVRGYREGEVFSSTGWRVTSELKTPPYRVGYVGAGTARPLTVRASVFMDYAETYSLDPLPGQSGRESLWGTGVGGVASLGPAWEARLWFGVPLLSISSTEAGQLRISFAVTTQF